MARIYPSANKMLNPVTETKGDEQRTATPSRLRPSDIKKMSTSQLELMAHRFGVDVGGCKNNTQRANRIIEAVAKADAKDENSGA